MSRRNFRLAVHLLLCSAVVIGSASAQSFKKVNVNGNTPMAQVVAGGASVWALANNGNPYVLTGNRFVLANTISLSQIAVGGGNLVQKDTVWGLNSSGNIYHATKSGSSWVFSQVAGAFTLVAVGPGYQDSCHPYEVWALNTGSQIFRYNFCGSNFDQETGSLCDIHVGGGDVWGAACGPNVYRFNFLTGSFDQVPGNFGAFPALTVGPNEVWAIDTGDDGLYLFDLTAREFRGIAIGFAQVQAAGSGIWGLDPSGHIYRLAPSTLNSVQVPGSLVSLSVGNNGVWGVNSSHQVVAFSIP